jgi:hypothetical protein
MKEICIPISNLGEDEIADVTLTIGGRKTCFSFRVESFPWSIDQEQANSDEDSIHASLEQIAQLRSSISNYDSNWELIQIYTPKAGATHIQVLYRKKNGN